MREVPLSKICGLFGKTRQAWYDIKQRDSSSSWQKAVVLDLVQAVKKMVPKSGTIKLYKELKPTFVSQNIKLGRDGLHALLADHGLLVKRHKKRVYTTQSSHHYRKWPSLIQGMVPSRPEQLWVSDITYLSTKNGFIHLSLITDAYSRKIVGYELSPNLKADGCIAALKRALKARALPAESLIHHSDRGVQYCCNDYVSVLQKNGVKISMTQTGSPYENALAERVNGILKQEFELNQQFPSFQAAVKQVNSAIYRYNQYRRHFGCDLQTPATKHNAGIQAVCQVKSVI
ncbi:transposase InsO family protein [Chitinophaga skermanii]|uniref:Transposase InsO family protein n=2 Tax=Chitinophaga skermanii TaxID=331697 RepID=A0A327Q6J4_9BACT|nr:transposase InsO family protein [Chitinophaga skermanii]RAI98398.1 transposase InsO family protein [Chitinophaga skermanii]RAI99920.1 transposase InsO family protein [Chitinophaga skermanii]RAJ03832.1 transposase InsO family protein [Chitinophaga skermanii]